MRIPGQVRSELLRSCAAHLEGERNALPLLAGVLALAALPSAGAPRATLWFIAALSCTAALSRVGDQLLKGTAGPWRPIFYGLRVLQSCIWGLLALFAAGLDAAPALQFPWLFLAGALLVVFTVTAAPLPGLAVVQGLPLFAVVCLLGSRQATLPLLPYAMGFAPALAMLLYPLRRAAIRDAELRIELRRAKRAAESASRELAELAATDELTRIPNRRNFIARANQEIARARRYRQILSVMMIDVDHFKGINDEHGHGTGDEVLRSVADLLDDALRETDLLARYGGDEFALLLPETPPAGARILAERLRGALEEAGFHASGRGLDVTFSCGIAAFDPSDKSVEAVIDRADVALYRAKRAGRNCIEVHGGADEPADTPAAVEGEEA